jgi:hypothetical protein
MSAQNKGKRMQVNKKEKKSRIFRKTVQIIARL